MLSVNSEYQRGPVWTTPQKKKLIDSVFRGYPLPLIYLHHIKTEVAGMKREDLEIIDGQQRINSLFEFMEGAFGLFDPINDEKQARFPDYIKRVPCPWGGRKYDMLTPELQDRFKNTRLAVVRIAEATDMEARDLFIRLQSGMPLNAQEKRDAWPGGYTEFILKIAGKPEITRYQGHEFFSNLIGAQGGASRGKARQLCAQMAMIFFERQNNGNWPDLKTQNIDDYYYKNLAFDINSDKAQRFIRALTKLVNLLGDGMRRKLKAHEAIHLTLLVDSLMDDYTPAWESKFALAFDKFVCCVNRDAHTQPTPGEFWTNYGTHTRTNAADAATIRGRLRSVVNSGHQTFYAASCFS
jgi:hypothetical protein